MTNPPKPQFLLILRHPTKQEELSPEQMQRMLERGMDWIRTMKASGHFVSGDPLDDDGKVLRGPQGRQMADGPFAEAKEIVAGYVLISAENLAAAVEIAKACPGLERDASVEVRPIETFPESC